MAAEESESEGEREGDIARFDHRLVGLRTLQSQYRFYFFVCRFFCLFVFFFFFNTITERQTPEDTVCMRER
jgi:hypothetical protein